MDAEDLDLRRPPVRRVRLALYLRADRPLSSVYIDGLRSTWRADYPMITELPPLPPDDSQHDAADDEVGWPLPFSIFESSNSGERVIFQTDRIAIDWEFGEADHGYPGYIKLRKELMSRFDELVASLVENKYPGNLQCHQVEVVYTNEIGTRKTLSFLGSPSQPLSGEGKDKIYDTYTRHYHWQEDAAGWITYMDSPHEDTELRIRQQWDFADVDGIDQWQALDACHDKVIEAFTESTTKEMRSEWR